MNILREVLLSDLFWFVVSLLAVTGIHGTFTAGIHAVVRLHTTSADIVRKDPRIKKLAKHAELNVQAMRFVSVCCSIVSGFLFYNLVYNLFSGSHAFRGICLFAFILFIFVYFLLCEMMPRSISLNASERFLRMTVTWMLLIRNIVYPFVLLIRFVFSRLQRIFRLPDVVVPKIPDAELQLKALGVELDDLQPMTRTFLENALQLQSIDVHDVLIPRNKVVYFDEEDAVSEVLEKAKSCGHTRFPLCKGDLDHCVGLIHIKDIFRYRGPIETLRLETIKRPIISIEWNVTVDRAIERMLRTEMHMALVTDEFGGSMGVVTLENLIEELVGDIRDEFDKEESNIVQLSENVFLISGLTPLHDVEDALNIEMSDDEDVSTLSGLITSELGRIPAKDERMQIGRMEIQVLQVDKRRVISVKVRLQEEEEEEPSGE